MPDIFTAPKKQSGSTSRPPHAPSHAHHSDKQAPHADSSSTPGMFSSLVIRPDKFTFAHQEKDEQILLFVRRHFITNFLWIAASLIAVLIPMIFPLLAGLLNFSQLSIPPSFTVISLVFYYLIIFGFAFFNFVDWFYNIGILTQKRLLDIDFTNLSYIDIAITQLPEIEDVVHRQKGFFASFFDYGDVIAHTVTGREDFVLSKIPRPTKVVDIMSKLIAD